MALTRQTVGNIGLYYVCYRLSREGWNVMPTSRNARGVDIVAYSDDGKSKLTFQVKALSKRDAVSLGKDPAHLTADFVIVCRYVQQVEKTECFVLASDEVKQLCHPSGKDHKISYWLEAPQYEAPEFRENWKRIKTTIATK
jgi:hypothetical protein